MLRPVDSRTMTPARVGVAVYVTRERDGQREVLVFDRRGLPEAGTRIPAGVVDPGERLDGAARREVKEETGVALTGIGAPLAVQQRPAPGTGDRRVTVFFHATTDEPRNAWTHLVERPADDGIALLVDCFFMALTAVPGRLADHQGEFVELILS
jgi:ADP-ribose pyrophosphatase YjhB (NUDIX family)